MNRMIKLFQQRSDQWYEKYLANREKLVTSADTRIDTPEWQAAVMRGTDYLARSETFAKCAQLLRKEELQK